MSLVRPRTGIVAVLLLAATLAGPVFDEPAQRPAGALTLSGSDIAYRWRRVVRPAAFGGRIFTERTRGATATLRFSGDRVVWYTERGPSQGLARLRVDGEVVRRVDNYAAERRNRVARGISGLGPGRHVLTIEVLGRPGRGSGPWVSVEAFRVGGERVGAGEATYRWSRRRLDGAHGGDVRVSSTPGARASATFTGKGVDWIAVEGPRYGRATLVVDGEQALSVDDHAPARSPGVVHSVAGLTDAAHTVTVEVGPNPADTVVAVDRFVVPTPPIGAFRGLGTWVDRYDYDLDPAATVPQMVASGVDTLYLATGRYDSANAFHDAGAAGAWLDAAKAAGMKVVGWYVPAYSEHLAKDVRRTARIATFVSDGGNTFDALAIDIEYKHQTDSLDEFNHGIKAHLRRVRDRVGNRYPVGAIVPAPVGMSLSPSSWTGFPWAAIGRYADVVLPMGYWSYRTSSGTWCTGTDVECARDYTAENIRRARTKTGLPVHEIGGIGDAITNNETAAYVEAVLDRNAIGGGLYDYKTTKPGAWSRLAPLARP